MKRNFRLAAGILVILGFIAGGCSQPESQPAPAPVSEVLPAEHPTDFPENLRWLTEEEKDRLIEIALSTPAALEWQQKESQYQTSIDWIGQMIGAVRRWLPEKMLVLVTDGGLTAVKLGLRCARYANPVTYVSRLRLDAVLHDPPGPQPRSKRGPKPKKGKRQPSLKTVLLDPSTQWTKCEIDWYGGKRRIVEIATGVALWYTPSYDPLP